MARRRAFAVAAPSRFADSLLFRLLRGVVILGLVLFLVLCVAAGVLTYRVITAHNDIEAVTPSTYLLSNFISLNFTDRQGGEHEGWLLLGLRGAPVVILCHGYNSNRSDMLSLGTVLRENHFNAYIFNFSGPKAKESYPNLGVRQATDVMDAIVAVTKQPAVNPRRVGLFGITMGGYAALVAAEQTPKVKALVVDTVYDSPDQLFANEFDKKLGGSSPLFRTLAEKELHLFTGRAKLPPVREDLPKLVNVPKLFISGRDTPTLAAITEELYNLAPQPKRLLILEHSQATLGPGPEKKEYENQVLNFFLQNLSLRAD